MDLLDKIIFIIAIISLSCCVVIEEKPAGPGKVPICHKGKTIYVDESAVDAHLGHGDYLGVCK